MTIWPRVAIALALLIGLSAASVDFSSAEQREPLHRLHSFRRLATRRRRRECCNAGREHARSARLRGQTTRQPARRRGRRRRRLFGRVRTKRSRRISRTSLTTFFTRASPRLSRAFNASETPLAISVSGSTTRPDARKSVCRRLCDRRDGRLAKSQSDLSPRVINSDLNDKRGQAADVHPIVAPEEFSSSVHMTKDKPRADSGSELGSIAYWNPFALSPISTVSSSSNERQLDQFVHGPRGGNLVRPLSIPRRNCLGS